MNLIVTIVAIVIIVAGAFVAQKRSLTQVEFENGMQEEVSLEGESTDEEEEPTTPNLTPVPRTTPTITPTPTPKPQAPTDQQKGSLRYPNSSFIRTEGETDIYESQDDSDRITDWYKEKIEQLGLNTTSFVKTKSNDNVLNKLVGADGSREVSVEISKPAGTSTVTIKVTTKNL